MKRDIELYLRDILESIKLIQKYTKDKTEASFTTTWSLKML